MIDPVISRKIVGEVASIARRIIIPVIVVSTNLRMTLTLRKLTKQRKNQIRKRRRQRKQHFLHW